MRTLVIQGKSIHWPRACACCLAPATRQIASQQTKTTFLVVASYHRTMSVQIPYCEECGTRVQASLGMTPWVKALLVFIGLFFGGAFVSAFGLTALLGSLFDQLRALSGDSPAHRVVAVGFLEVL